MAQLLPPGMYVALCLEATLVGTSLAVSFNMRFVSKYFPWLQESFSSGGINSLCARKLRFVF